MLNCAHFQAVECKGDIVSVMTIAKATSVGHHQMDSLLVIVFVTMRRKLDVKMTPFALVQICSVTLQVTRIIAIETLVTSKRARNVGVMRNA